MREVALPAVEPAPGNPAAPESSGDDPREDRRRLVTTWAAAGSAVAAMIAASWTVLARNGGRPPGGDMIGHGATAHWLRTLPWWDWRGWSTWFYGGQAIGVNYPPLGHAWMRFTDPEHGQMAAVAVGLLVLLPWGALRLARALGFPPRAQRATVGAVLVLTAAAGEMHWVLSGFHLEPTFYGSWPAMVAVVLGLFCAAWSARCHRPVRCGLVAGSALLFNATVIPGIAVVCLALLAQSGASFRQASRWAATAAATALAVCAWWLVPFIEGWSRLVQWRVTLASALNSGGSWQVTVIVALFAGLLWAALAGPDTCRRPAVAVAVALSVTLAADLGGYLRAERWLEFPLLVAAIAVGGAVAMRAARSPLRAARPAWIYVGGALVVVFVVVTGRIEVVPLVLGLLLWPQHGWALWGALAWTGVLLFVPLVLLFSGPVLREATATPPLKVISAGADPGSRGMVFLDPTYNLPAGDPTVCPWGYPWRTTRETSGAIRPLAGLYRETGSSAEFHLAEPKLRDGHFRVAGGLRPDWFDAWDGAGRVPLDTPAAATALGARWYATCEEDGELHVSELPGVTAGGVTVAALGEEDEWHRAAVDWWVAVATGSPSQAIGADEREKTAPVVEAAELPEHVPVLTAMPPARYPPGQAADGVTLVSAQDRLTVRADSAGWAWLRVPWDPYWTAHEGTPVHKGGPGHLVVWVNRGTTELTWAVPRQVDVAAAATTAVAAVLAIALAGLNRRNRFDLTSERRRPAAEWLTTFADTVDGWAYSAADHLGRTRRRRRRRLSE